MLSMQHTLADGWGIANRVAVAVVGVVASVDFATIHQTQVVVVEVAYVCYPKILLAAAAVVICYHDFDRRFLSHFFSHRFRHLVEEAVEDFVPSEAEVLHPVAAVADPLEEEAEGA